MKRWIPVTERFPEKNGNYLVTVLSSDGTANIYFEDVEHYNVGQKTKGWLHYNLDGPKNKRKVIAWQPLPEPYKEVE